mmetsp:Transcript_565/g.1560  ORF Transcript_565/g.1560 Transcript_565/m.1560 type:complete len:210 (+) Transcript_565:254-883(+)
MDQQMAMSNDISSEGVSQEAHVAFAQEGIHPIPNLMPIISERVPCHARQLKVVDMDMERVFGCFHGPLVGLPKADVLGHGVMIVRSTFEITASSSMELYPVQLIGNSHIPQVRHVCWKIDRERWEVRSSFALIISNNGRNTARWKGLNAATKATIPTAALEPPVYVNMHSPQIMSAGRAAQGYISPIARRKMHFPDAPCASLQPDPIRC